MQATSKRKSEPLVEADWIHAARRILIEEGIKGLSLRRLAAALGVTTGAFYWLFGNFDDLLDKLRQDWEEQNNLHFSLVFESPDLDSRQKYIEYLRILLDKSRYDPEYDGAIRDWAPFSPETAATLQRVDDLRIRQLESMYQGFGNKGLAARVHAELAYFHQIGYYLVGASESLEQRLEKLPFYAQLVCPDIIPLDSTIEDLRALLVRKEDLQT